MAHWSSPWLREPAASSVLSAEDARHVGSASRSIALAARGMRANPIRRGALTTVGVSSPSTASSTVTSMGKAKARRLRS